MSTDPYVRPPPAQLTALIGGEAAAWHAPQWWKRHWELTGLVTDVTARMQDGSRDDWIRWLQTSNDASNGERLLTVLTSMPPTRSVSPW